jgi:hypothetical protein
MSPEGQNYSPENTQENAQRFVLNTKEGLREFRDFIVSEEKEIDALNPDLMVEDLALPNDIEASLQNLRLTHGELVLLTENGLQEESGELSEDDVDRIIQQYQIYQDADEKFSIAYVDYTTKLEDKEMSKTDIQEASSEDSELIPAENESFSESRRAIEKQLSDVKQLYDSLQERLSKEAHESQAAILLEFLSQYIKPAEIIWSKTQEVNSVYSTNPEEDLSRYFQKIQEIKEQAEQYIEQQSILSAESQPEKAAMSVDELSLETNTPTEVFISVDSTDVRPAEKEGLVATEKIPEVINENHTEAEEPQQFQKNDTKDFVKDQDRGERLYGQEKPPKRGVMEVKVDSSNEGSIKISVADRAENEIRNNQSNESVIGVINELARSLEGRGVVAKMEKQDVVNSINNSLSTPEVRNPEKNETGDVKSLTAKYLIDNPRYQALFQENSFSPGSFEKQLQATIKSIDAKEIDFWESSFDEPYKSTFLHLQDMTLNEIEDFNALSLTDRKEALREENIKYEAYLAWMDVYGQVVQTIALQPNMKFGEIFAKWMAENELPSQN